MSKLILTDVDDVILRWGDAFQEWVLSSGRFDPKTNVLRDSYDIKDWLGITHAETRELITEFNHHPDWFPHIPAYSDAVEYLPRLKSEGFKFIAITACAEDDWTRRNRAVNLNRYFPEIFDAIHCVGLGASKLPTLELYKPAWWVDDKPSHCVAGVKSGHKAFLYEQPYNLGIEDAGVKRVKTWADIYQCITTEDCHPGWYA